MTANLDKSNRLRALIADRRQKDGAYGTERIPVCLDQDLVAEYNQLLNKKTVLQKDAERSGRGDTRLSEVPEVDEIDARLEELHEQIEAQTAVMVFQSMGDKTWSEFRSQHDDIDAEDDKVRGKALDDYFDAMLAKCFLRVEFDGEATDLTLEDFTGKGDEEGMLSFMQAQELRGKVQGLNLRGVSVPFSPGTSNGRRKTSRKSK